VDHPKLTQADHADLVQSLSYALRFTRSGKRTSQNDLVMANATAERILEALKLSGYVVMKGPPAQSAIEAHARPSEPPAS